jgi:hypothetical protein
VTIFGGAPKPEALERYAELGVDRVLFVIPPESSDAVLPRLDDLAALAAAAS